MQEDHIHPQQRLKLPAVWLEKHENFVRDFRATVDLNFYHIFDDCWNLNSLIIPIFVFLSLHLHHVLENVRNVVARSEFYLTWHSRPFEILLLVLCVSSFDTLRLSSFTPTRDQNFSFTTVCVWTALLIDSQVNMSSDSLASSKSDSMTSYAAESLALKRCIVRYRSAILLQIRERQKTGEHQLKIGERHNQVEAPRA